jgi:hypothetical protein
MNWNYEDICFIVQDIENLRWAFERPAQSINDWAGITAIINELFTNSELAYHQLNVVARHMKQTFGLRITATKDTYKRLKEARLTLEGRYWAHADIAEHYIDNSEIVACRRVGGSGMTFTLADGSERSLVEIAANIEDRYPHCLLCRSAVNTRGAANFVGKMFIYGMAVALEMRKYEQAQATGKGE